jgi:hypothetical protein
VSGLRCAAELLGLKTVTFASRIKSLGIVHPTRSIKQFLTVISSAQYSLFTAGCTTATLSNPAEEKEKERTFAMNCKWTVLDLLIGAMEKLSPKTGERQNALAFIQSCYGGRVRSYDLDQALVSLAKLTPEEQNCLINWTLVEKNSVSHLGTPAAA